MGSNSAIPVQCAASHAHISLIGGYEKSWLCCRGVYIISAHDHAHARRRHIYHASSPHFINQSPPILPHFLSMFYSQQLLARKAPLGMIWMAATMHAKIHRRKLDQLNLIKICEEILNPAVPMALRLSSILMGGVVIVYQRKVKLLHDDVNRLLFEINDAWKVKKAPSDPNRLPKGKSKARFESVTLPPINPEDLGDIGETENTDSFSNGATMMDFRQTSYISMRLDRVDELFPMNIPLKDLKNDHHQVDAADITLNDIYDAYQADAATFDRYERFDVDGGEDIQMDFNPVECTEIPTNLVPSPPRQDNIHMPHEIPKCCPEEEVKPHYEDNKEQPIQGKKIKQRVAQKKAKAKWPARLKMDYDQAIIPGQIYQSWLKDTSDIMSKRGSRRKVVRDTLLTLKKSTLMALPSIVLAEKLVIIETGKIHYPVPLMDMWKKCIQPQHDSPSGKANHPPPQPSSSPTPPEGMPFMEPSGDEHFEDVHSGVDTLLREIPIANPEARGGDEARPLTLMEKIEKHLKNKGLEVGDSNVMSTPQNSGNVIKPIYSSGSERGFSHDSDVNSGRSSKKRSFHASNNSGKGLEAVPEEGSFQHSDPTFKLPRLSETDLAPNDETLLETEHTQTQRPPVTTQPLDPITDSIRMQLKTHFNTPGRAQKESLSQLAMALASHDCVKVEQEVPYGDILISKGAKM